MRTGKKEGYAKDLKEILDEYVRTANERKMEEYIASNSNLPGPRGNLELAHAFADAVAELSAAEPESMWDLASDLASLSPDEAPVNDPKELIPFCGAIAIGAMASLDRGHERKALARLREMAEDPRWRTREGVAMGLQRMIAKLGPPALKELEGWITDECWLAMRAVAAGVAEPPLLKDPQVAAGALDLHRKIVARMIASDDRKNDGFRTLRQALGYSLSVVVRDRPVDGFKYLRELASSADPDVRWVLRENLKKSRLTKGFPGEVEALKALM